MAAGAEAILKAHWECWSKCNLKCGFCYRMRAAPLSTANGHRLVDALADYGIRELVFAGGDPSLRPDIRELVGHCVARGVRVEIQTNAQRFETAFASWLNEVDLFGFSLDAPTAEMHDRLRGRKGNHSRVLNALNSCDAEKTRYVVRTVLMRESLHRVAEIAPILVGRPGLIRWSLLAFSPVGDGFVNRDRFALDEPRLASEASAIKEAWPSLPVDVFLEGSKGRIYFLIKPNGDVYTTQTGFSGAEYASVGNVLADGVDTCLKRLSLDSGAHLARYGGLMGGGREDAGYQ